MRLAEVDYVIGCCYAWVILVGLCFSGTGEWILWPSLMVLVHWILGDLCRLVGISMVIGSGLLFAVDSLTALGTERKGEAQMTSQRHNNWDTCGM